MGTARESLAETLRRYMDEAGCSGKELAAACGLAPSTVSRYLAGTRVPDAASLPAKAMARALCELAGRPGRAGGAPLDEAAVRDGLLAAVRATPSPEAGRRLATLLDTFGVTRAKLADALGYSASYVSRVCSGARTPSDFARFAQAAGRFFAERAEAAGSEGALANLCGGDGNEPLEVRVAAWLHAAETPAADAGHGELEPFLRKLDAFDLDKYLAALGAGMSGAASEGRPAAGGRETGDAGDNGFRLYTGIDGFCQAELDFLACAAAEPAGSSVTLFSDMPMQDKMEAHPDFPMRWLSALATLVRSGHAIDNVHNVGRSLPEMMLGLEAWLPLYMTGMVRPYYLPAAQHGGVFGHLVRTSETTALEGQAVAGAYGHVGCQLFRDAACVAHFRRRSQDLLACAKPLASIYTARKGHELAAFLAHEAAQGGARAVILSAPPLFTMDDGLLEDVLATSGLDAQEAERVRATRSAQLARVEAELSGGEARVSVARVTPEGFAASAAHVALGEAFCTRSVPYGPEAYARHVALTERFAAEHPAWHLEWIPDLGFRNIQINVRPGAWALVSKNTSPAIHFVLCHKKMVEAFARFEMPVVR